MKYLFMILNRFYTDDMFLATEVFIHFFFFSKVLLFLLKFLSATQRILY